MSREIKRVPLDFDAPLGEVWPGYLMPDSLSGTKCPDCTNGYSYRAQFLHDLWYGYVPFEPEITGSTRLRYDTPAVRVFAERNLAHAPEFYGAGEIALMLEGERLADLFNSQWSHHLTQEDVDALVAADRLYDFTSTWSRAAGWQKIEPPVIPTAEQVNEWSLRGFGHDSINASVVVRARCEREGVEVTCPTCGGESSIETYPGQRAEAEAWECTEPPTGDGWQLWETISEGSPKSPVFDDGEKLARWMSENPCGFAKAMIPYETALKWVTGAGWSPSFAMGPDGLVDGITLVANMDAS